MARITNPVYTDREKAELEFVLAQDFPERDQVVEQLNRLRESELTRDVTPYYRILEFRPDGANPGQGPVELLLSLSVGQIPTCFLLFGRNGLPFELEIFHADSSEMDMDTIPEGKPRVHYPE